MDHGHRVLWVTRKGSSRQPVVLARLDAYLAGSTRATSLLSPGRGQGRPLVATATGGRVRSADMWDLIAGWPKPPGCPASSSRTWAAAMEAFCRAWFLLQHRLLLL